jgi:hypothetical protein|tara:strand:- start:1994 stop:2620 length:627 start_codon:yes stop_codon:yes gene_type:complete
MQEYTQEMKGHGSQLANKVAQIDPSFSMDMPKQQQADNVSIYELEQVGLIDRVKHMFAGEMFNPQTGQWDKMQGVCPPMNDKGVHHFMIKFSSHLDKNITLSDFTVEQIGDMMVEICYDILEVLWKRHKEFEIKRENFHFIMHILEHQIFANYMRAKDGGERKHRETLIKSVESVVDRQEMTKRGGSSPLSFLNPFNRGNIQARQGGL